MGKYAASATMHHFGINEDDCNIPTSLGTENGEGGTSEYVICISPPPKKKTKKRKERNVRDPPGVFFPGYIIFFFWA